MRQVITVILLVALMHGGNLGATQRRPLLRRIFTPDRNHRLPAPARHHPLRRDQREFENNDPYARDPYPRYYGGFHVRHLQDIGIPSGDIGIRGNGVFWPAW